MDTIGDIKKLDAFLTNLNVDNSDSESDDSDELVYDNKRQIEDSSSDEQASDNGFDPLYNDPDVQDTITNCTDANLRKALIGNLKKRHILSKIYNKLTAHLNALEQFHIARRNKEYRQFHERKRVLKSRLGAPFFKDHQCYPSPRNSDLLEMLRNKRLPQIYYIKTITWKRSEKNLLAIGVYEDICEKKLVDIAKLIKIDQKTEGKCSEELLALQALFSDKNYIMNLAENWKTETLENVEEEIVKLETHLGVNRNHLGFNLHLEPNVNSAHKNTELICLNTESNQYKVEYVDVKAERSLELIDFEANTNKTIEKSTNSTELVCVGVKIEHINRENLDPSPSTSKSLNNEPILVDNAKVRRSKRKSNEFLENASKMSKKAAFIESDARKRRLAKIAERNQMLHQLKLRKQAEQRMARKLTADELKLMDLNKKYTVLNCISNWSKNVDWLKMSVTSVGGRHADFECIAFWNVYLNPKISKKPWTDPQNEKLKHFAEEHRFQDWDLIAKDLNINKTAYQCCVHFHTKLCDKHNSETWTPEEDEELRSIVELCRVGETISWGKVAFYFKTRDRVQLYNRYRYVLAPVKKGAFSEAEDILLLTLLKIFGKNMTKIVTYFQNRQITQLRNRLSSMHCPIREWSLEDDHAIIQHVHKHGEKHWKLLDIGQNTARIRHRFQFIKKWSEMNPNGDLENIQRRNKNHRKAVSKNRSEIIDQLVTKLSLEAENHKDNYKILNIPYIERQLQNTPAFKQKRKLPKQIKTRKRKPILDDLMLDFFKTTHKHVGRTKTHLTYVDESAKRIKSICAYLDVNLELPSIEILTNHPQLDDFDKEILLKLKELQLPHSEVTYFVPPSPETLVGFRGLWLLHPTLYEHAKGRVKSSMYIYPEVSLSKTHQGYHFCKARCEQYLTKLDKTNKTLVMNERQMFWRRFYALFKWPCLLSDIPESPKIIELPPDKPTTELVKRGRPKKNLSAVQRMNQAKLAKKQRIEADIHNGAD